MTQPTIELKYVAEHQPSLCIPRVFANITENRIRRVFDELLLGKISRIDMIEHKSDNGETHKRVFIHFEKWFWNQEAQLTRQRLISGKDIKIVYDNPWFWKVSANRSESRNTIKDMGSGAGGDSKSRIGFTYKNSEMLPRAPCLRGPPGVTFDLDAPDTRRQDTRRPDTRRPDTRRPDTRDSRRPILPLAPKLVLKTVEVIPRSPSSSPPRIRQSPIQDSEFYSEEVVGINYNYENIVHNQLAPVVVTPVPAPVVVNSVPVVVNPVPAPVVVTPAPVVVNPAPVVKKTKKQKKQVVVVDTIESEPETIRDELSVAMYEDL